MLEVKALVHHLLTSKFSLKYSRWNRKTGVNHI